MWTLYRADALKGLEQLPDESVHCAVTSPPYWGLTACLTVVNDVRAHESVFACGDLVLGGESADVALIHWSASADRCLLLAECSFRYKSKRERYGHGMALAVKRLFEAVQQWGWCTSDAVRKMHFVHCDVSTLRESIHR